MERRISIRTVVLSAVYFSTILLLLLLPKGQFPLAAFFIIKRCCLGNLKVETKPPCWLFVLECVSIFTDLLWPRKSVRGFLRFFYWEPCNLSRRNAWEPFEQLKMNGIDAYEKIYQTFQRNSCLGRGVFNIKSGHKLWVPENTVGWIEVIWLADLSTLFAPEVGDELSGNLESKEKHYNYRQQARANTATRAHLLSQKKLQKSRLQTSAISLKRLRLQ